MHTPEFPFERDVDNVREAATDMNVEYPIALDPDFAVSEAFSNRYWPAAYFADAEGRSATTSSEKADTKSANGSSSSCCGGGAERRHR